MLNAALYFATASFSLGLVFNAWRIMRAEGVPDRVLALDTMTVNAIALIVLAGIASGRGVLFEIALLFAMTGFVGTVAYSRFMLRGDLIE
ncbi:K+/H+ antiporter subunit F [Paracoccus suum]|uniref:K+/H+ antiporter subunit F n=1 Tax=Paracoccus suum TaxID=2259340 RepID=A0A344PPF2_9RHOB|nr:K+/H+ antiporter subunit F [Paracoccus suum]